MRSSEVSRWPLRHQAGFATSTAVSSLQGWGQGASGVPGPGSSLVLSRSSGSRVVLGPRLPARSGLAVALRRPLSPVTAAGPRRTRTGFPIKPAGTQVDLALTSRDLLFQANSGRTSKPLPDPRKRPVVRPRKRRGQTRRLGRPPGPPRSFLTSKFGCVLIALFQEPIEGQGKAVEIRCSLRCCEWGRKPPKATGPKGLGRRGE